MGSICGILEDGKKGLFEDLPDDKVAMDDFMGKWSLESKTGYDQYLKDLKVNKLVRSILCAAKCKYSISMNDENKVVWKIKSGAVSAKFIFKLEEPFEAKTLEKRNIAIVFKIEKDRLIERQTDSKGTHDIIRTLVDENTTMVEVCHKSETLCRRTFTKKVEED